jgi:hypothetical protein
LGYGSLINVQNIFDMANQVSPAFTFCRKDTGPSEIEKFSQGKNNGILE